MNMAAMTVQTRAVRFTGRSQRVNAIYSKQFNLHYEDAETKFDGSAHHFPGEAPNVQLYFLQKGNHEFSNKCSTYCCALYLI